MRQFNQAKYYVAALSMMASFVFGFLLRQLWQPLLYCVWSTQKSQTTI